MEDRGKANTNSSESQTRKTQRGQLAPPVQHRAPGSGIARTGLEGDISSVEYAAVDRGGGAELPTLPPLADENGGPAWLRQRLGGDTRMLGIGFGMGRGRAGGEVCHEGC